MGFLMMSGSSLSSLRDVAGEPRHGVVHGEENEGVGFLFINDTAWTVSLVGWAGDVGCCGGQVSPPLSFLFLFYFMF
jgi:hypothetical protein